MSGHIKADRTERSAYHTWEIIAREIQFLFFFRRIVAFALLSRREKKLRLLLSSSCAIVQLDEQFPIRRRDCLSIVERPSSWQLALWLFGAMKRAIYHVDLKKYFFLLVVVCPFDFSTSFQLFNTFSSLFLNTDRESSLLPSLVLAERNLRSGNKQSHWQAVSLPSLFHSAPSLFIYLVIIKR